MKMRETPFRLDRKNGKLLGLCAGLARTTGLDANLIRVALVVATVAGGWPWTVIAYAAAVLAARWGGFAPDRSRLGEDPAREERLREHEDRMREIDRFIARSDDALAREIEELR